MRQPEASAQTADDIYAPPKANLDLEAPYLKGCSREFLDTIIADQSAAPDTTQ